MLPNGTCIQIRQETREYMNFSVPSVCGIKTKVEALYINILLRLWEKGLGHVTCVMHFTQSKNYVALAEALKASLCK